MALGDKSVYVEASDEQYVLRLYYGSGANDYIESDPFYVKVCEEHVYSDNWEVEKPASINEDGVKHKLCLNCGEKAYSTEIKAISTVKLSYDKITYTGDYIKSPDVVIKDLNGKQLIEGEDYSFNSVWRKDVGTYTATVTFIGDYGGKESLYYTIVPKKSAKVTANLSTSTATDKYSRYDDIKFSWGKSEGATGYLVYYKKVSSSKWSDPYIVKGKTYYYKKNLTDGVKYSFKVIPYFESPVDGKKYYSTKEYRIGSTYTLKKILKSSVTKSGTKVKVKWKNINGETGYQISRSTKKSGTNIVYTYKTTKGTYKTITAKKGVKYYYKVRAYKVVDGKKVYGPWSYTKAYKR